MFELEPMAVGKVFLQEEVGSCSCNSGSNYSPKFFSSNGSLICIIAKKLENVSMDAASTLLQLSTVSSAISVEGPKKRKKRNMTSVEGAKEICLTSMQVQQKRVNDKNINEHHKKAFNEACCFYNHEITKIG